MKCDARDKIKARGKGQLGGDKMVLLGQYCMNVKCTHFRWESLGLSSCSATNLYMTSGKLF